MKKLSWKTIWKYVYEYFFVAIAGSMNAISLSVFINPNKLIAGGFSGLASIIYYIVDGKIESSIIYFIVNVPILICSIIFLRGDFTVKTIFATVVCTLVMHVLPKDLVFTESKLICVMFGAVLIGTSMYLASIYNGSNGGTEIIARLVNKYKPEVDLSKVIFLSNTAILIGGTVLLVLQGENILIAPYSFIYIIGGANFMSMLTRGFDHPQKFLIVTTEYERISQDILEKFQRGLTVFDVNNADGSPSNKKMIMVIVQYRQASLLKRIIRKYDKGAFTIVKDVYDVFSRPLFNRSYKLK